MKYGYDRFEQNLNFKEFYSQYLKKWEIEGDKILVICVADSWLKTDANRVRNNIVATVKFDALLDKNKSLLIKEKFDGYSVNGAFGNENDDRIHVLLTKVEPAKSRIIGQKEAELWFDTELIKLYK